MSLSLNWQPQYELYDPESEYTASVWLGKNGWYLQITYDGMEGEMCYLLAPFMWQTDLYNTKYPYGPLSEFEAKNYAIFWLNHFREKKGWRDAIS